VTVHRWGDVWLADLNPVAGNEQGGRRPCLVVSVDAYNRLPIHMAIVVPLTSRDRGLAHQPPIARAPSGLDERSFARPEDLRTISADRLVRRLGQATTDEIVAVAAVLRTFLDL
jgi:mRNA interferase MazF